MKLWIDDVRPAPEGYVWCQSVNETIRLIQGTNDVIEVIDIDHDAGDYAYDGGDYIHILDAIEFMVANKQIKEVPMIHIHSMNIVGVENMKRIIRKNGWKEI